MKYFSMGFLSGIIISILFFWLAFLQFDVPFMIRHTASLDQAFQLSSIKESDARFEFFHRSKDSAGKYSVLKKAWTREGVYPKEISLTYLHMFIDYDGFKEREWAIRDNIALIVEIIELAQKNGLISSENKQLSTSIKERLFKKGYIKSP